MIITDAKDLLDAGHTLQLETPAPQARYMPTTHHAQVKSGRYTYSIFHPGFSVKWEPLSMSADWETFIENLPQPLRTNDTWEIL